MRNYLFTIVLLANGAAVAADEYSSWLKEYQGEYQSFLEERDREFSSYLNSQWSEFTAFAGLVRDPKPKPVKLPAAKPQPITPPPPPSRPLMKRAEEETADRPQAPVAKSRPELTEGGKPSGWAVDERGAGSLAKMTPPVTVPPVITPPRPLAPPPLPVPSQTTIEQPKPATTRVDFYGEKLYVTLPKGDKPYVRRVDKGSIAKFWEGWASVDHKALIADLNRARRELGLNDWATLRLSYDIAGKLYSGENERLLFAWFIYSKAGYKVKVGHDGSDIFLLLITKQKIYERPYLTIGGERYYIFRFADNKKAKRFYSFEQDYPGSSKLVDMTLPDSNFIGSPYSEKKRTFRFNGREYTVSYPLNDNYLKFLASYPQSEFDVYFESSPLRKTSQALLTELSRDIQGMDKETATNFLLRFVQTAFAYKTDDQNFGMENYLFPDETLYFPYSDCEDRSFLFAWLVRNLLGLEVVGLTYPGHVATAVLLPASVKGDRISYGGKRYLVSDPTYVNANVGMTMPQFKNKNPEVIRIQ